jgi:membrane protein EpsK
VPKNLIANALYFTLNVLIGLLLVPYFIDNLGVASYGLIPLATSLTSYVNLVTQSLNSSVSRYLTIDLQRQNYKKANITFNTSLFGTFGVSLLTIPILVVVSYYAPLFFDIPINQRQDAFLLFLGVMGSILVRTWGGNFGVSLFAYNRLDLQNIINSINLVLQVIFIIILFSVWSPKLSYIGYSYFIAAATAFIITILFSKKVNPHFKVKIHDFNGSRLKELMGTGGWITIDQIGSLLLFQIDIILVNKLYGTIAGGEYSIVFMWNSLIRTIAGMLAGVLTPVILTYYAQKKFEELIALSRSAVKIMGLAMALPIGLICGFSPLILSLWVGSGFIRLSPLMWVLLGHLAINMSVLPLFPINVSYNKLRIPAIATILSGIANIVLAITLSTMTGWGYYGVAVSGAIVLTARHFFFVPMYATKVLGMSKNPFKSVMIQVFLSTIIVSGITSLVYHFSNVSNVLAFIINCGIISLAYLIIIWFTFMSKPERRIVESSMSLSSLKKLKISTKSN